MANNLWDADKYFYTRAHWRLRFMWLPKRCAITGRWLWFRFVYEGAAKWADRDGTIFEFRYHEPTEHIIWQLKGNYNV